MPGSILHGLDYLQRTAAVLPEVVPGPAAVPIALRSTLRVTAVGHTPSAGDRPPGADHGGGDLLAGLYGQRIPVAMELAGGSDGLRIRFGSWTRRPDPSIARRRRDVLTAVLRSRHRRVETEADSGFGDVSLPLGGLALGVPTHAPPLPGDSSAPLDRVVRAMSGLRWAVLVLAQPVAEPALAGVRASVLNEMRAVAEVGRSEGAPSPLAEQYDALLRGLLHDLVQAGAVGGWRAGVYLLGDADSYPVLSATWRAVFAGAESLPEMVRVVDLPPAVDLAAGWELPDAAPLPYPGHYARPFELQTLLTSTQLGAYVHLPRLETPGFAVRLAPSFDVVPAHRAARDGLPLGEVLHDGRGSGSHYEVSLRSLNRHTCVTGVTGSGKTNTIFHLLDRVDRHRVPFLVVEPAKTEYRNLLRHPGIGPRLRVFTLGDEGVAPLRLNPFEPLPGTSVLMHLDLLRSLFTASFGMWNPLPQILEQALFRVYEDHGWRLVDDGNERIDADTTRHLAFPTMSDLHDEVERVIARLGYDEEISSNMRAALSIRLGALRMGGKGRMLDTRSSTPPELLFGQPAVLELERLGDDDDKAFVMGLILIRLTEYRRALGSVDGIAHLLVVEEAHRLLGRVDPGPDGSPKAKAVQAFVDLLAEVRAYGQGVVVADQVPVRLAPEVVKNTNLKITHRLVAEDDREVLAATMAMPPGHGRFLATLNGGEAAVFAEGDDAPLLTRVPLVKDLADHPSDAELRTGPPGDGCPCRCATSGPPHDADLTAGLADEPVLRRAATRLYTTMSADPDAVDRRLTDLADAARPFVARATAAARADTHFRCLAGRLAGWFARRRGADHGWPFGTTEDYADALRAVVCERIDTPGTDLTGSRTRIRLAELARSLYRPPVTPYPACELICPSGECLFRHVLAERIARGDHAVAWAEANGLDLDTRYRAMFDVGLEAADQVVESVSAAMPPELASAVAARSTRAALCFGQQLIVADPTRTPTTVTFAVEHLLAAASPPQEEKTHGPGPTPPHRSADTAPDDVELTPARQ